MLFSTHYSILKLLKSVPIILTDYSHKNLIIPQKCNTIIIDEIETYI